MRDDPSSSARHRFCTSSRVPQRTAADRAATSRPDDGSIVRLHRGEHGIRTPLEPQLTGAQQPSTDPPAGTVYHQSWWLDAVSAGDWLPLTTCPRSGFVAQLPLFQPAGPLTQRMITNPPLTRTLGPVFTRVTGDAVFTEDIAQRLTADLVEQMPSTVSFSQVFAPQSRGLFSFAQAGFRIRIDYTYWIAASEWPDEEGQMWQRIHPKTRRQLRRASERYQIDRMLDVDAFVEFYGASKRADGGPLVPGADTIRTLLAAAVSRSSGSLLGCRASDGRLAGAVFVAYDQCTAHLVMTARDPAVADSGAVGMLVWDALTWARESRRSFDLDGSTHFVSQFGGEPVMRWNVSRLRTADRALRWVGLI